MLLLRLLLLLLLLLLPLYLVAQCQPLRLAHRACPGE